MCTKFAIIRARKILMNKICLKLFLPQGNRVKTAFKVTHRPPTELSSYSTSSEMCQMAVL